jgi:hypothetical protein
VWQVNVCLFEYRERHTCVKLRPVEADLEERTEVSAGSHMFEELKGATNALFVVEMAVSNAEVAPWSKDNRARRFGAVSSL